MVVKAGIEGSTLRLRPILMTSFASIRLCAAGQGERRRNETGRTPNTLTVKCFAIA